MNEDSERSVSLIALQDEKTQDEGEIKSKEKTSGDGFLTQLTNLRSFLEASRSTQNDSKAQENVIDNVKWALEVMKPELSHLFQTNILPTYAETDDPQKDLLMHSASEIAYDYQLEDEKGLTLLHYAVMCPSVLADYPSVLAQSQFPAAQSASHLYSWLYDKKTPTSKSDCSSQVSSTTPTLANLTDNLQIERSPLPPGCSSTSTPLSSSRMASSSLSLPSSFPAFQDVSEIQNLFSQTSLSHEERIQQFRQCLESELQGAMQLSGEGLKPAVRPQPRPKVAGSRSDRFILNQTTLLSRRKSIQTLLHDPSPKLEQSKRRSLSSSHKPSLPVIPERQTRARPIKTHQDSESSIRQSTVLPRRSNRKPSKNAPSQQPIQAPASRTQPEVSPAQQTASIVSELKHTQEQQQILPLTSKQLLPLHQTSEFEDSLETPLEPSFEFKPRQPQPYQFKSQEKQTLTQTSDGLQHQSQAHYKAAPQQPLVQPDFNQADLQQKKTQFQGRESNHAQHNYSNHASSLKEFDQAQAQHTQKHSRPHAHRSRESNRAQQNHQPRVPLDKNNNNNNSHHTPQTPADDLRASCVFCLSTARLYDLEGPFKHETFRRPQYAHRTCALFAAGRPFSIKPNPNDVVHALIMSTFSSCVVCGCAGAAISCIMPDCQVKYHLRCARAAGCRVCDCCIFCAAHSDQPEEVLIHAVFSRQVPDTHYPSTEDTLQHDSYSAPAQDIGSSSSRPSVTAHPPFFPLPSTQHLFTSAPPDVLSADVPPVIPVASHVPLSDSASSQSPLVFESSHKPSLNREDFAWLAASIDEDVIDLTDMDEAEKKAAFQRHSSSIHIPPPSSLPVPSSIPYASAPSLFSVPSLLYPPPPMHSPPLMVPPVWSVPSYPLPTSAVPLSASHEKFMWNSDRSSPTVPQSLKASTFPSMQRGTTRTSLSSSRASPTPDIHASFTLPDPSPVADVHPTHSTSTHPTKSNKPKRSNANSTLSSNSEFIDYSLWNAQPPVTFPQNQPTQTFVTPEFVNQDNISSQSQLGRAQPRLPSVILLPMDESIQPVSEPSSSSTSSASGAPSQVSPADFLPHNQQVPMPSIIQSTEALSTLKLTSETTSQNQSASSVETLQDSYLIETRNLQANEFLQDSQQSTVKQKEDVLITDSARDVTLQILNSETISVLSKPSQEFSESTLQTLEPASQTILDINVSKVSEIQKTPSSSVLMSAESTMVSDVTFTAFSTSKLTSNEFEAPTVSGFTTQDLVREQPVEEPAPQATVPEPTSPKLLVEGNLKISSVTEMPQPSCFQNSVILEPEFLPRASVEAGLQPVSITELKEPSTFALENSTSQTSSSINLSPTLIVGKPPIQAKVASDSPGDSKTVSSISDQDVSSSIIVKNQMPKPKIDIPAKISNLHSTALPRTLPRENSFKTKTSLPALFRNPNLRGLCARPAAGVDKSVGGESKLEEDDEEESDIEISSLSDTEDDDVFVIRKTTEQRRQQSTEQQQRLSEHQQLPSGQQQVGEQGLMRDARQTHSTTLAVSSSGTTPSTAITRTATQALSSTSLALLPTPNVSSSASSLPPAKTKVLSLNDITNLKKSSVTTPTPKFPASSTHTSKKSALLPTPSASSLSTASQSETSDSQSFRPSTRSEVARYDPDKTTAAVLPAKQKKSQTEVQNTSSRQPLSFWTEKRALDSAALSSTQDKRFKSAIANRTKPHAKDNSRTNDPSLRPPITSTLRSSSPLSSQKTVSDSPHTTIFKSSTVVPVAKTAKQHSSTFTDASTKFSTSSTSSARTTSNNSTLNGKKDRNHISVAHSLMQDGNSNSGPTNGKKRKSFIVSKQSNIPSADDSKTNHDKNASRSFSAAAVHNLSGRSEFLSFSSSSLGTTKTSKASNLRIPVASSMSHTVASASSTSTVIHVITTPAATGSSTNTTTTTTTATLITGVVSSSTTSPAPLVQFPELLGDFKQIVYIIDSVSSFLTNILRCSEEQLLTEWPQWETNIQRFQSFLGVLSQWDLRVEVWREFPDRRTSLWTLLQQLNQWSCFRNTNLVAGSQIRHEVRKIAELLALSAHFS